MFKVSVSKSSHPYNATMDALSHLKLTDISNRSVLLKPNAARVRPPSEGATTNPEVVAAVIDFFRDHGVNRIAIGESPITGVKVSQSFDICGIRELAEKKRIRLLDFDNNPFKVIPVPEGRIINKIKVTCFVDEYDYVVSIPVMKTHMHTVVTLSVKNMKGMLWRRQKVVFHQIQASKEITGGERELNIAIADMATVLYPDLVVIDGSIGMEGMGPSGGDPKGAGIIVAGENAVAADMIASRLMGINPHDVPHLRLVASHRNTGYDDVSVLPADYLNLKSNFTPSPDKISFNYPDVEIYDEESCSACLTTIFLFLKRYHKELEPYQGADGKLHLAIGKGVRNCSPRTIYVGNCSCMVSDSNDCIKVTGCPPIASQIWESLTRKKCITYENSEEVSSEFNSRCFKNRSYTGIRKTF